MRVTILTTGSRGDVQPFVALGTGLRAAGHHVCLATHSDFSALAETNGLSFSPILAGAKGLHGDTTGLRMIGSGNNPFAFLREFIRMREPFVCDVMEQAHRACRDADLIVASAAAVFEGQSVAEKLGKPLYLAFLQPSSPTRYLTHSLCPAIPRWLQPFGLPNLISHYVIGTYYWICARRAVNRARAEVLQLPPHRAWGAPRRLLAETPVLYGFSEAVVPRPPDWDARHHITGYWFLDRDEDWQPDAGLRDFLRAGPPPVAIGFGSMCDHEAEKLTQLVLEAVRAARCRAVLLTGWGGLQRGPHDDHVFVTSAVPHDWLLPRSAAAVHHGGAGTTAACLRAGIPSLVVPFMCDQFFWGRRVHALGAGPTPLPRKRLTAAGLAEAMRLALHDPAMRQCAAEVGRKIRAEDGVRRAVAVLEGRGEGVLSLPPLVPRGQPRFAFR